ncbi:MAG: hypothetical protein J0H57_21065, partial [Rhodospirillales bacterium]|nr:hypothetical protein [Rhodospirillales bacterium]
MSKSVPDDAYQSSFREAFQAERDATVDALPAGDRVLDVPCWNGFHSRRLAHRLRAGGRRV